MKKKYIKTMSLVQAVVLAAVCMNGAGVANADSISISGDNIIVEPERLIMKETPSPSGNIDVEFVNENGEPVEFELSPEGEMMGVYPSYYNIYDDGSGTSVKNQGQEGLCWAFASMATMESNLIRQNMEPATVDLSEKHMAWFVHGAGPSDVNDPLYGDIKSELGTDAYDKGGNIFYVASSLARGSGPVYDALVPQSTVTALDESLRYESLYSLKDVILYDKTDFASIKNALMTTGAVYVNYRSNSGGYDSTNKSHYSPNEGTTDHAVTIVGWDDNFSKDKFKTTPPDDGAWIIKNSWGSTWGDQGYFYLSYYDATIGRPASINMGYKDCNENINQYDGNYYTGVYYSNYGSVLANIFTSDSDEYLNAVSFWTSHADTPYNIMVYTDIPEGGKPDEGTLVYSQSGDMIYGGYHKVELDEAVEIPKGCRYSVVAELMKNSTTIGIDSYSKGEGISYYSAYYGSRYGWVDAYTRYSANVCLKAYTTEMTKENEGVEINEDNFPDDVFRTFISAKTYDKNSDGWLSDTEIAAITTLNVTGMGIEKLKGTEFLTALKVLKCSGNNLGALDIAKNTNLTYVDCSDNGIKILDLSDCASLNTLICSSNKLTELHVPQNAAMDVLQCDDNQLVCFDLGSTTVSVFSMNNNEREIAALEYEFELDRLQDLDPSRITAVTNAVFDKNRKSFAELEDLSVTYSYDCGQGKTANFTLIFDSVKYKRMSIEDCIEFVNNIDLTDPTLTYRELMAIKWVLEYDFNE